MPDLLKARLGQWKAQLFIETMGPISDRSREHLGGSDLGIIHWRARLVRAVQGVIDGAAPPALDPAVADEEVRAISTVVD